MQSSVRRRHHPGSSDISFDFASPSVSPMSGKCSVVLTYAPRVYGLIVVTVSLLGSVFRLGFRGLWMWDHISAMAWFHWLCFVLFSALMLFFESYRGFHKSFSPLFAARMWGLCEHRSVLARLLAPLTMFGLIYASPSRIVKSWLLVGIILVAILVIRLAPAQWRSILDASVAIGLGGGTISLLATCYRVARSLPTASAEFSSSILGCKRASSDASSTAMRCVYCHPNFEGPFDDEGLRFDALSLQQDPSDLDVVSPS